MSAAIVAVGVSAGTSAAASDKQAAGIKRAQEIQQQQFQETKAALNKANKEAQGYIYPYASTGRNALDALAYGMGLSGSAASIPTDAKIGTSNDPIWNYTLQQYKSGGGKIKGKLTDPRNAGLLQQLQGQYTATQQGAGASSGIGRGSLMNYGMEQYKQDPGYTPMVNSLEELQATPGYQFQLEQGLQGVNNSAAARGGLLSGANMKAINDYAQGQASTGYASAWERAQNAYTNAFGRNQQKFTNLQSMANNGQNAAEFQGKSALGTGTALAGASQDFGNNMGSLAMAQGQNSANNINQIGNAIGGGISRIGGLMGGFGGLSGGGGSAGGGGGLSGLASGNAPSSMVNWNYNPQL